MVKKLLRFLIINFKAEYRSLELNLLTKIRTKRIYDFFKYEEILLIPETYNSRVPQTVAFTKVSGAIA